MSLEFLSLESVQQIAEHYGYWAVMSGIMLENMGLPIPGETITLVGGFLAGSGDLTYPGVLAAATGGAIVGDNFGYWIGKWGGWPLLKQVGGFFGIAEEQLNQAREEFGRNAARAVFIGRFVALLRVFAGPLAGIAGMPYHRFFVFNTAGAVVWATTIVSLAFFVGRIVPLEQLLAWVSQFGVAALLAVVAFVVYWIIDLRSKQNQSA